MARILCAFAGSMADWKGRIKFFYETKRNILLPADS